MVLILRKPNPEYAVFIDWMISSRFVLRICSSLFLLYPTSVMRKKPCGSRSGSKNSVRIMIRSEIGPIRSGNYSFPHDWGRTSNFPISKISQFTKICNSFFPYFFTHFGKKDRHFSEEIVVSCTLAVNVAFWPTILTINHQCASSAANTNDIMSCVECGYSNQKSPRNFGG